VAHLLSPWKKWQVCSLKSYKGLMETPYTIVMLKRLGPDILIITWRSRNPRCWELFSQKSPLFERQNWFNMIVLLFTSFSAHVSVNASWQYICSLTLSTPLGHAWYNHGITICNLNHFSRIWRVRFGRRICGTYVICVTQSCFVWHNGFSGFDILFTHHGKCNTLKYVKY